VQVVAVVDGAGNESGHESGGSEAMQEPEGPCLRLLPHRGGLHLLNLLAEELFCPIGSGCHDILLYLSGSGKRIFPLDEDSQQYKICTPGSLQTTKIQLKRTTENKSPRNSYIK